MYSVFIKDNIHIALAWIMTVLKPRYDNEQKCYLLAELKDEISFWKNRALKDEKIDHFEGLKSELNAQILTATCIQNVDTFCQNIDLTFLKNLNYIY